jgi:hypothetical protein
MQCSECSVPHALRLPLTPSPKSLLTMQAYLSSTIETNRPTQRASAVLPITAPMPLSPSLPPTAPHAPTNDGPLPADTIAEPEIIYSADGAIASKGFPYRIEFFHRKPSAYLVERDLLDVLAIIARGLPVAGDIRAGIPSFAIPSASPDFMAMFNATVKGCDLVRIEEESYVDFGVEPGDVLLVDLVTPRSGWCRLYDRPVAMIDEVGRAHFGWYGPHELTKYHEVRNTMGMEIVGLVAAHCPGL